MKTCRELITICESSWDDKSVEPQIAPVPNPAMPVTESEIPEYEGSDEEWAEQNAEDSEFGNLIDDSIAEDDDVCQECGEEADSIVYGLCKACLNNERHTEEIPMEDQDTLDAQNFDHDIELGDFVDESKVNEGHIYDLDTKICANCGAPREEGINSNADDEKLCADCYKYTHDAGIDVSYDSSQNSEPDDFETYNQNEADDYRDDFNESSIFPGRTDRYRYENCDHEHVREGYVRVGGHNSITMATCLDCGAPLVMRDEDMDWQIDDRYVEDEFESVNTTEDNILKESDGYYVTGMQNRGQGFGRRVYVTFNSSNSPIVTDLKNKAHIFGSEDLGEAKAIAAKLKGFITDIAVKPVLPEENNMNESLSPERRKEGLNGAAHGWENEPNEQIAGWKALVQDADGPNNPKDMFNPVKGSDNIETVARNKRHPKLHEDSPVETLAKKLQYKFSALKESNLEPEFIPVRLKNKRIIGYIYYDKKYDWWGSSCPAFEAESGGIDGHDGMDTKEEAIEDVLEMFRSCNKRHRKIQVESSKQPSCSFCNGSGLMAVGEPSKKLPNGNIRTSSKAIPCKYCKKVTESDYLSAAKSAKETAEKEMDRVFANPKSSTKERDAATEDFEDAKSDYDEAKKGNVNEERIAATVAKKKNAHPKDYCKVKGCLWRTKDKPCEKHKPAVKESEEGNEMKSKEVTEAKLSGVTRFVVKHLLHAFMKIFRPGALKEYPNLINDLINLDPSDVKAEDLANIFNVSVEDAHEILEVGVANNDFTKLEDNSYSLKPTDTVVEAINKSKAKKLQAMVDSLGKRVAKLSAPPSAKTKITQSLERFEQKLAAMKDSLKDKGEPEENDSEEEPTEKKSSKKEFPAKKKSFGDSDEKPKASKKEAGTSEEKSKSEPAKEGEDAEPKPKEQKETKSDKPDTNGDDSTPKGKVKDIGKGIYESESALLREYSKLIAEADKEEEEKAPLVSRPHDDHPRNKKPRLLAPTTKHGIAGNMSVPTRG